MVAETTELSIFLLVVVVGQDGLNIFGAIETLLLP